MKKSHKIKADDYENYELEHVIASSVGKGSHKQLAIVVKLDYLLLGTTFYRVKNDGVVLKDTKMFIEAVDVYNELP